jgi:hypothetical protein
MRALDSDFYRWCARAHSDFLTCLFDIVPHTARTGWTNMSDGALAAAWVSQTCDRHGRYLGRLMAAVQADSMGGCCRNCDELVHPGMHFENVDSIWWCHWEGGAPEWAGMGARKMLLASQYKLYVSLEDTIMDDCVTEKLYEGPMAHSESLLVFLGAPNAQVAPGRSATRRQLPFFTAVRGARSSPCGRLGGAVCASAPATPCAK